MTPSPFVTGIIDMEKCQRHKENYSRTRKYSLVGCIWPAGLWLMITDLVN